MACVVIYPNPLKPKPGRPVWHLVSGQLDGRPRHWHVTIKWWVPEDQLEEREQNPRGLTVRSPIPMYLDDLMAKVIQPNIDPSATRASWRAVQER